MRHQTEQDLQVCNLCYMFAYEHDNADHEFEPEVHAMPETTDDYETEWPLTGGVDNGL